MAQKSARVIELEDAIAEAVSVLDEADGSRIGALESIDSAREVLKDAYGVGFEKAVGEFIDENDDNDDDDESDLDGGDSED
jgi:hypothetical protein